MTCPESLLLTIFVLGAGVGSVVALTAVAVARSLDFWRSTRGQP